MVDNLNNLNNLTDDELREKYDELGKKIVALDNEQLAKKTLLNSCFGGFGNKYFQFFDPNLAESITLSGQLSLQWITRKLNEYFSKILKTQDKLVIYGDTDSVYLELSPIVDACCDGMTEEQVVNFLDQLAKEQIEPIIDKAYQELAEYMNAYDQKMSMKREAISSCGFWSGKKRYALLVHDNEGVRYAEPKLKIMGLEIVKSSTPEAVRDDLKKLVKVMLTDGETAAQKFIEEVKKKFFSLSVEDIASPRGVNNLEKFVDSSGNYKSGIPIHVRAAHNYNKMVDRTGIVAEKIKSGDKIKFVKLKTPNPLCQNVIAFPSHLGLPDEFGLKDYVDYATIYDQVFLSPAKAMLDAVKWEAEKQITLEDFF